MTKERMPIYLIKPTFGTGKTYKSIDKPTKNYESEYHSTELLNQISNWDCRNIVSLMEVVKSIWQYKDQVKEFWSVDRDNKPVILLELATGGWRGNEDVIEALQNNIIFWQIFWLKSERGGKYTFEIDFTRVGYKPMTDFLKEKGFTRQYVCKASHKFDIVCVSSNKRFIRDKKHI